jgi:hypothetical protein
MAIHLRERDAVAQGVVGVKNFATEGSGAAASFSTTLLEELEGRDFQSRRSVGVSASAFRLCGAVNAVRHHELLLFIIAMKSSKR